MKSKVLCLSMVAVLLSSVIMVPFQNSYGLNLVGLDLNLVISPSTLEPGKSQHDIGYVYLVNKLGVNTAFKENIEISLTSDSPNVATVPEKIILEKDTNYAQFSINTNELGSATITATVDNLVSSQKITVGSDASYLPDDIMLVLALPTENMHIDSEMPFSVYLKTPEGQIIRAPIDIQIRLEYDKNIASPDTDYLTIKKGDYYAWGILHSGNLAGNAFLRAIQDDLDIDSAKSVKLSSTLPTKLQIQVFPKFMTADIGRQVDAFVSLLDADGNPTIAPDDIPLSFFSNNQDMIGNVLEDMEQTKKMTIKKGEFGYHLNAKFNLVGFIDNDIEIGVSAKGYGIATDTFTTVKKIYDISNDKFDPAKNRPSFDNPFCTESLAIDYPFKVVMYGPDKIPPNSKSVIGFQIGVLEDDDDDPVAEVKNVNGTEQTCTPIYKFDSDDSFDESTFYEVETDTETCLNEITNADIVAGTGTDSDSESSSDSNSEDSESDDCSLPIINIDNLKEGRFYPVQGNKVYTPDGMFFEKVSMITSNKNIVTVVDPGMLQSTASNGYAVVQSGALSGDANLSTTIKGIGSQTFPTQVINTLEQKETRLFSPVGDDVLLANSEGYFDVFLVAIDQSDRPKKQVDDSQYLVSPTNAIIEIKKDQTFSFAKIKSDILTKEDETLKFQIHQVGEGAISDIDSEKEFTMQTASVLKISLVNQNVGTSRDDNVGTVQLVDLQGNPVAATKNIATKITSSDDTVLRVAESPIIPQGSSYADFKIETKDKIGSSTITASARGVIPSSLEVKTVPSASKLKISTSGMPELFEIGVETEIKIFVDDADANPIAGALITPEGNAKVEVTPKQVRTGNDGSAKIKVTALDGPEATLSLSASKEGYIDVKKDIILDVNVPSDTEKALSFSGFEIASWMIYVIIAAVVVVGVLVALFFRKTKDVADFEEEEEEEI